MNIKQSKLQPQPHIGINNKLEGVAQSVNNDSATPSM